MRGGAQPQRRVSALHTGRTRPQPPPQLERRAQKAARQLVRPVDEPATRSTHSEHPDERSCVLRAVRARLGLRCCWCRSAARAKTEGRLTACRSAGGRTCVWGGRPASVTWKEDAFWARRGGTEQAERSGAGRCGEAARTCGRALSACAPQWCSECIVDHFYSPRGRRVAARSSEEGFTAQSSIPALGGQEFWKDLGAGGISRTDLE